MARKDLLKSLIEGTPETPAEGGAQPRMGKGAIGAVSQSIADLRARALVEVPPDMIDAAGLQDRLDEDEAGIAALADSIAAHGQQVPVLLRHSPNVEGRYEVVYGRRRVAALRRLGLPVRAMVRDLDDRGLIVAQGQENSARKGLSFIEQAVFAQAMLDRGFSRRVIGEALHLDKTVISRMLAVTAAIPLPLIRAIGAAPSAGRDRWLTLAAGLEGRDADAVAATAQGDTSDARFAAVMRGLAGPPALPSAATLLGADGGPLGEVKRTRGGRVTVALSGTNAAFADWLLARMAALHREWRDETTSDTSNRRHDQTD